MAASKFPAQYVRIALDLNYMKYLEGLRRAKVIDLPLKRAETGQATTVLRIRDWSFSFSLEPMFTFVLKLSGRRAFQ